METPISKANVSIARRPGIERMTVPRKPAREERVVREGSREEKGRYSPSTGSSIVPTAEMTQSSASHGSVSH